MKWEKYKLSSLVEKPISGEWGDGEGSIKVIRSTNFTNDGTLDLKDVVSRNIPQNKVDKKQLKKGDVIIEKSGGSPTQPVGRVVHFLEEDQIYLCNNFTSFLRPKINVNPRYLFWCLFSGHINGSTLKYQNKTTGIINLQLERYCNEFEVTLPPLHIQEQIADTLDKADALRRKDQELLQKYDQLAQAIFYDMFGDPVRNEKGWNISSIRDVCTFSQGVQIPLEEQSTEYRSGLYRFLRISDYTQTVEPRYVSLYDRKAYVQKDDIVMVRYGASAGYVGTGYEGILANNLFKLGFERATLTSEFLYFYLNSTYVRAFITEVAFGAAMPALSFKVFDNLNIILPPVKLQERFSEIIQLIRRSSTNVYKSQNLSNLTFETTSVSFFS